MAPVLPPIGPGGHARMAGKRRLVTTFAARPPDVRSRR